MDPNLDKNGGKEKNEEKMSIEITTKTMLPDIWRVYGYDHRTATKHARNPNNNIDRIIYPIICDLHTLEEVFWFVRLMGQNNTLKDPSKIEMGYSRNIDMFTFVIMRCKVEPTWEDNRNKNGGTWSALCNQKKGYDIWRMIVLNMVGETLTSDCNMYMNGINYSYIAKSAQNASVNDSSYIKIWDGYPKREKADELTTAFPANIRKMIEGSSIQYKKNSDRADFAKQHVYNKFKDTMNKGENDFHNRRRGYRS